jgi:multidrug efflux system membrane fusion protein
LIPEQALSTDQNIKFVYVVASDGTATRRAIELGHQRAQMRIVTAGLKAGERVIVKGAQRVRSGQRVEAELAQIDSTLPAAARPVANGKSNDQPVKDSPAQDSPSRDTQEK